tara:strand:- start:92 stop:235 length:144 start_codon:yes stop_codon:yes gene_type:complete
MKYKKTSTYVMEEWAKEKGLSIKQFMEWLKTRRNYSKVKKFWKELDK